MRLGGLFTAILVAALWSVAPAGADVSGPFETSAGPVRVERVAGPFDHPWAIAFLPKPGTFLVTERSGTLRVVRDGSISAPVRGVPPVLARGQGGLLDVVLDPDFARTSRIFLTFSEPVQGGRRGRTALATGLFRDDGGAPRLEDVEVIFRQEPALGGSRHFGSRIVFSDDGKLYLTLGDRGSRDNVQDLSNHLGKVIRLNLDGSVPSDNPFVGQDGVRPEIWSYGHRNPQGAAKRPSDGAYFTISHGAGGGDEVNRPKPGKNFGWPEVSYGTHYSGRPFPAATRADVEPPLHYWDPSIAPSGAAFYDGDLFPEWKGDLFVGALRYELISRLDVDGDRVSEAERLFEDEFGRIRDVRVGPEGALWFATDDDEGGIYRILPAR